MDQQSGTATAFFPLSTDRDPINFTWLSERCFEDLDLMRQVLQTFHEEGNRNINAMRSAVLNQDTPSFIFHTVRCCTNG